jgi:hypothetical protein
MSGSVWVCLSNPSQRLEERKDRKNINLFAIFVPLSGIAVAFGLIHKEGLAAGERTVHPNS